MIMEVNNDKHFLLCKDKGHKKYVMINFGARECMYYLYKVQFFSYKGYIFMC